MSSRKCYPRIGISPIWYNVNQPLNAPYEPTKIKYRELLRDLHPDKNGNRHNESWFYNLLAQDIQIFRTAETYNEYREDYYYELKYYEYERLKRVKKLFGGRKPWLFDYNPELESDGNCTNWTLINAAKVVNFVHGIDNFLPTKFVDDFWNMRIFKFNKANETELEMFDDNCKRFTMDLTYKKDLNVVAWSSVDSRGFPFFSNTICQWDILIIEFIVCLLVLRGGYICFCKFGSWKSKEDAEQISRYGSDTESEESFGREEQISRYGSESESEESFGRDEQEDEE
ncbi:fa84d84c-f567-41ae-b832-7440475e4640-CDS [Sclerotinia trifoliorum]|uniref:Fa84d84c-f567-41ae-b832-7440475e4640-CDS n=1 Tax=Sclerotinia trifoliorum TaxID=28548 RepID=A0A8H2ZKQ9_9HELO|nr:fa84d84c-f567-41ae-b832-7440475e4640-CDS [Sclerotinia trifoliorum]